MQFTEKQLNKFRNLYKETFGDDLSDGEVLRQATALVTLVKLTYKPITKGDFERIKNLKTSCT